MKSSKILSAVLASLLLLLTLTYCSEEDGITYSMKDVSSRITGFGTEKAGTGAPLTIHGSAMDKVLRVFIGNQVVPRKAFTEVTESSITFNVPSAAATGADQPVLIVFRGSERATKTIEVMPFQSVSDVVPRSASEGETVTLLGSNLDVVADVKLGTTSVTITSQSPSVLKFTVPAGFTDAPVTMVSEAGISQTEIVLTSCTPTPTAADCADGLNLNAGFELGDGDNFTNWGKWNGGTVMVATTAPGEVYRGSRAVKVIRDGSLGSGQWRLQLASDPVTTEVGASYTVYIWAKASVAGGSMRVSTNPNALYTDDQLVPTTWTRLAFTFTANELSTRAVLDMNGNNTVATNFFIDDVKMIKN